MHNQVPPDPFPQPAAPDAAPQSPAPPQSGAAAQQPYADSDLPQSGAAAAQQPYAGSDLPPPPYQAPLAYGPPPGYPSTPAMAPGTNGFAIGALISSICGGLGLGSVLGLTFGIIALRQIRRRPQKGRGLAIAALVISGLTLVTTIAVLAAALIGQARDRAAGIDTVGTTELEPGDCIRSVSESSAIYDLPVMPCDQPHGAEVYHVFTLAAGPYPGQTEVETESEKVCGAAFEQYLTPQTENMQIYYLYPRSIDWRRDRGVTCIAIDPAGTRTTSLVR